MVLVLIPARQNIPAGGNLMVELRDNGYIARIYLRNASANSLWTGVNDTIFYAVDYAPAYHNFVGIEESLSSLVQMLNLL